MIEKLDKILEKFSENTTVSKAKIAEIESQVAELKAQDASLTAESQQLAADGDIAGSIQREEQREMLKKHATALNRAITAAKIELVDRTNEVVQIVEDFGDTIKKIDMVRRASFTKIERLKEQMESIVKNDKALLFKAKDRVRQLHALCVLHKIDPKKVSQLERGFNASIHQPNFGDNVSPVVDPPEPPREKYRVPITDLDAGLSYGDSRPEPVVRVGMSPGR